MQTNLPIRSISDFQIFSHNLTNALQGRIDSMATRGIHSIYIRVFFVTILLYSGLRTIVLRLVYKYNLDVLVVVNASITCITKYQVRKV